MVGTGPVAFGPDAERTPHGIERYPIELFADADRRATLATALVAFMGHNKQIVQESIWRSLDREHRTKETSEATIRDAIGTPSDISSTYVLLEEPTPDQFSAEGATFDLPVTGEPRRLAGIAMDEADAWRGEPPGKYWWADEEGNDGQLVSLPRRRVTVVMGWSSLRQQKLSESLRVMAEKAHQPVLATIPEQPGEWGAHEAAAYAAAGFKLAQQLTPSMEEPDIRPVWHFVANQ